MSTPHDPSETVADSIRRLEARVFAGKRGPDKVELAAVDLRETIGWHALKRNMDAREVAQLVRKLGEQVDALLFELQWRADADVIAEPEPFGEKANRIADSLELKARRDEEAEIEDRDEAADRADHAYHHARGA